VWQSTADSNGCLVHFFKVEARNYTVVVYSGLPNTRPSEFKLKKNAPNGHFNLQRAIVLAWMGNTALWGHITALFEGQSNRLRK
jgi:hypothetical protein